MKYLLWLAFLGVLWWLWSKRKVSTSSDSSPERAVPEAEKMVTCIHCGVHLPESEGLNDGGLVFCCEAHRAAHRSEVR